MGCGCSSERKTEEDLFTIVCDDYEELESFSGTGIKRTRAWRGSITKAQLKARRELFWMTRTTDHRFVWIQLRQAVEADPCSCYTILEFAGVCIVGSNIQKCQDFEGNCYNIPIFVINDPVKFLDDSIKVEPAPIQVNLRTGTEDTVVNIMSNAEIRQLKSEASLNGCRMFFCGKELSETTKLYEIGIESEMTISVFKSS